MRGQLAAAIRLVFFLTLIRVSGGFVLLWWLGAPSWALAAWILLHVKFKLDLSKFAKGEASRKPELSGGDATEAQEIRPEGMDAIYAIGALRDFAKDKAHLGERTFALSELRRYLSGGRS